MTAKLYRENKELYLQKMREYYNSNKYKAWYKKMKLNYRKNWDPRKKILCHAKYNARAQNLKFNLSIEDIKIPDRCPFLGIKLTNIQGKGRINSNMSLDKIIPTNGYVKGNVQVISDLANRMKNNASIKQLKVFAKNILEIYK